MLTLIAACWIGRTLSYPFPRSRLIWKLIEFLIFPVLLLPMAKDSTGKAAKRYSLETNSSLCSIWHTPKIAFKRVEWSEQEMAVLTGCWVSSQEPVWNWHRRALGRSPTLKHHSSHSALSFYSVGFVAPKCSESQVEWLESQLLPELRQKNHLISVLSQTRKSNQIIFPKSKNEQTNQNSNRKGRESTQAVEMISLQ